MTATEILSQFDPELTRLKGELIGKTVKVLVESSPKKDRTGEVLNVSRDMEGKIFFLIQKGKSLFPIRLNNDLTQTLEII